MKCPICGWEFGQTFEFEQVAETLIGGPRRPAPTPALPAVPAGVTLEHKRPARAATVQSDVAVPVIQATVTGFLCGGLGGVIAAAAGSPHVFAVAGIVGGGVAGITWGILLHGHHRLLWEIETITGLDLDGDGEKGKPTTRIEITVPSGHGQQTKILELDATPEQVKAWAKGMLAGRMSEADWCGKGKLFSKPKFLELRQQFIERGLLMWVNPDAHAQGTELTAVGRWVCKKLSK